MTDRLDEIRARAEAANRTIILGQTWTSEQEVESMRAKWVLLTEDIPYLLAEVERLRAALASLGYRLTRKDDGSDYVYWVGKDPVTEGGES